MKNFKEFMTTTTTKWDYIFWTITLLRRYHNNQQKPNQRTYLNDLKNQSTVQHTFCRQVVEDERGANRFLLKRGNFHLID